MSLTNANTSITQVGRVVVNAAADSADLRARKIWEKKPHSGQKRLYENSSVDDLYLPIVPGEPLFMYKKKSTICGTKKRKVLRDTDLLVFSSFNGVIANKKQSADDFEDDVSFMGFADIQTTFNSSGNNTDDAVTQVGGLRTTVNTGDKFIAAGSQVYWALPNERTTRNHTKIVAKLLPLSRCDVFTPKALEKRIIEDEKSGDGLAAFLFKLQEELQSDNASKDFNPKWWADKTSKLYREFYSGQAARLRSKVVGVAMSDAKPGQEFDVLIGAYCT